MTADNMFYLEKELLGVVRIISKIWQKYDCPAVDQAFGELSEEVLARVNAIYRGPRRIPLQREFFPDPNPTTEK